MLTTHVLVKNFESDRRILEFGDFTLRLIDGQNLEAARSVFPGVDVYRDNWWLSRDYTDIPDRGQERYRGSEVGSAPHHTEDTLLLFRLFQAGDISFASQSFIRPREKLAQFPHRMINPLLPHSIMPYRFLETQIVEWQRFSTEMTATPAWRSNWFSIARKYFLWGGNKEFLPQFGEGDRFVDYTTSLEAVLVTGHELLSRKFQIRGAALLIRDPNSEEHRYIRAILKELYGCRSTMVHGDRDTRSIDEWQELWMQVESLIRNVLNQALRTFPEDETEHRRALMDLYEPTQQELAEQVIRQWLPRLKDAEVREEVRTALAPKVEPAS